MAKNGEETRLKTPKTAARLGLNLKHDKKIQQRHREPSHQVRIRIKDQLTFIARVLCFVAAILNFLYARDLLMRGLEPKFKKSGTRKFSEEPIAHRG